MRITVDPGRCCSAGVCVLTAPEVFDQSDVDGTVVLLTDRVAPGADAEVREAIALCPSHAIAIDGTDS